MSINLYLKEEVRKIPGFIDRVRHAQGGETWNEYEIPGVRLYHKKGRWYTTIDETDPIPPVLVGIVTVISLQAFIPIRPKRESGRYKHKSAKAKLECYSSHNYEVTTTGEKLEDILELFYMIKIGSIRPEESFEGEQGGLSREELLARMKEALALTEKVDKELKETKAELKGLREDYEQLKAESEAELRRKNETKVWLNEFIDKLREEKWPFCTKVRMIKLIGHVASQFD